MNGRNQLGPCFTLVVALNEIFEPLVKVEVLQIVYYRDVVDPLSALRDELVTHAAVTW